MTTATERRRNTSDTIPKSHRAKSITSAPKRERVGNGIVLIIVMIVLTTLLATVLMERMAASYQEETESTTHQSEKKGKKKENQTGTWVKVTLRKESEDPKVPRTAATATMARIKRLEDGIALTVVVRQVMRKIHAGNGRIIVI
jgi:predicted metalloprotease